MKTIQASFCFHLHPVGGIGEIVQHEVNGLLIEPGSVRARTDTLLRLVRDPVLLANLKAGARTPRTSEQRAREIFDLYVSLLRRKSPAPPTATPAFAPR